MKVTVRKKMTTVTNLNLSLLTKVTSHLSKLRNQRHHLRSHNCQAPFGAFYLLGLVTANNEMFALGTFFIMRVKQMSEILPAWNFS
ncbi:hypothetical protein DW209_12945 [Enterobacter hormaechei]|nr:hypothetical protein DW209_12945 [Enterobacter hormaechei]